MTSIKFLRRLFAVAFGAAVLWGGGVKGQDVTTFEVTFSAVSNGELTADTNSMSIGTSPATLDSATVVTFTATPEEGYIVKQWKVGQDILNSKTDSTLTLTIVRDTAVLVEFEAIPTPAPDSALLTLASLTLAFDSLGVEVDSLNLNGDTVRVGYDTTSVTIAATATDSKAEVSGDSGVQSLKVGKNIFTLTVTDTFYTDRSKSYKVVIFRKPAAATEDTTVILDFTVAEDEIVTVTTLDTAISSPDAARDSIQKQLFDHPNCIVFEQPISIADSVGVAHAGCSVDSIKLDVTDLEGKISRVDSLLKDGENIIKLGGNYELRVYKSLDTTKSIRKKFGTLTFVNNPKNNGVGERFESFKWYRNGTEVVGTGQYYVLPKNDDSGNQYTVSVTHINGWLVNTCPSTNALPQVAQAAALNVFPNPATAGSMLSSDPSLDDKWRTFGSWAEYDVIARGDITATSGTGFGSGAAFGYKLNNGGDIRFSTTGGGAVTVPGAGSPGGYNVSLSQDADPCVYIA